jgi:hypothetical protein
MHKATCSYWTSRSKTCNCISPLGVHCRSCGRNDAETLYEAGENDLFQAGENEGYNGIAVLPTGETLNPAAPQGAVYYDPTLVAYILWKREDNRSRPTRVLTSSGLIAGWKLETVLELYHDQTGAQLGSYRIVGIVDFTTGEWAGNRIDFALKHSVLK